MKFGKFALFVVCSLFLFTNMLFCMDDEQGRVPKRQRIAYNYDGKHLGSPVDQFCSDDEPGSSGAPCEQEFLSFESPVDVELCNDVEPGTSDDHSRLVCACQAPAPAQLKLSSLPPEMIRHIASFLDFDSFLHFSSPCCSFRASILNTQRQSDVANAVLRSLLDRELCPIQYVLDHPNRQGDEVVIANYRFSVTDLVCRLLAAGADIVRIPDYVRENIDTYELCHAFDFSDPALEIPEQALPCRDQRGDSLNKNAWKTLMQEDNDSEDVVLQLCNTYSTEQPAGAIALAFSNNEATDEYWQFPVTESLVSRLTAYPLVSLFIDGKTLDSRTITCLGNLIHLRELIMVQCGIRELPSLEGLTNLQALIVPDNRIEFVSEQIGSLTNLRFLDLRLNQLHSLPATIGRLRRLRGLWLCGNEIAALPDEIGNLEQLRLLTVGSHESVLEDDQQQPDGSRAFRRNALASLPPTLGNLRRLERLFVMQTDVREIPQCIGRLSRLREFLVWRNRLESIPQEVGALKNLTHFDCYGNNIHELPLCEISRLQALEKLDISENDPNLILSFDFLEQIARTLKGLVVVNGHRNDLDNLRNLLAMRREIKKSPHFITIISNLIGLWECLLPLNPENRDQLSAELEGFRKTQNSIDCLVKQNLTLGTLKQLFCYTWLLGGSTLRQLQYFERNVCPKIIGILSNPSCAFGSFGQMAAILQGASQERLGELRASCSPRIACLIDNLGNLELLRGLSVDQTLDPNLVAQILPLLRVLCSPGMAEEMRAFCDSHARNLLLDHYILELLWLSNIAGQNGNTILGRLSAQLGGEEAREGDLRNAHILRMVSNVARVLSGALADCNQSNADMIAAVQSAMEKHRIECSHLSAQRLLLAAAVLSGNRAYYIQAALQSGINANMVIDYHTGDTLLHLATRCAIATEQQEIIQVLLHYGADASVVNKNGETPFTLAESAGRQDLTQAFTNVFFA